jgi:hypothetical protein
MSRRPRAGVEVQLYSFFNLGATLGWVVNATPRPLYPREKDPAPIVQEAGWSQCRSGRAQKISSPLGFDPRTVQPVVRRYTDYALPAHLTTLTL